MTGEEFALALAAGGDLAVLDLGERAPPAPTPLAADLRHAWQGVVTRGTLLPYLDFGAPNGAEVSYPTMQSMIAGEESPERGLARIEESRQAFLDSLQ